MKYDELEKLVEEVMKEAKKKNPCQFVISDELYAEDETGEEVAKLAVRILKDRIDGWEPQDPPYEQSRQPDGDFKREWKIFGSPVQRGPYTAELAKRLRDGAGIEAYSSADQDLYEKCHNKKLPKSVRDKGKGIILFYEMESGPKQKWYFAYKPSKQANKGYARKYEGNLIYAINVAGGQSAKAAEKLSGERNQDKADQASADSVINEINWGGKKPTKAERASGGALKKVKLSPIYEKYGVTSKEPKTDIFISFGKDRKNVSVKAATGAQYASAQGPEAVAIFEAAFKDVKGRGAKSKQNYYKTVKSILEKFGDRATGEGTATFEGFREQYAKETGEGITALQGDVSKSLLGDGTPEELAQIADQLIALAKNPKAIAKVVENQKKKLDELGFSAKRKAQANMQRVLNESVDQIDSATQKWMSTPEARKLILREAVTGENKFLTKEAIADAVLKWDDTDFSKSGWSLLDDKWFSDNVGLTKYDFRSRGGSGLANRGIAFRLDSIKENKKLGRPLSSIENQELTLLWEAMLLTEGPWSDILKKTKQKAQQFISVADDKLKKLGAKGKEIYSAIKEMASKAWEQIKDYAQKIYEDGLQFVSKNVRTVQEKIMSLTQDFGVLFPTLFDVGSTTIEIGEGTATATPEMTLNESLTKSKITYKMLEQMVEEAIKKAR
jgi:hypothetical protein